MSGVVAFEGELNSIIHEYLAFGDFDKTALTFRKECTDRGKPVLATDKPRTNEKLLLIQTEMIVLFDQGKRNEMFELWNEYIPEDIRTKDTVAQKLEFYLNIYFAIFPMKHNLEKADEAMNEFKLYLETRGSTLSQTTEFLPFYALPFVPNPMTHPSYKDLFSERWVPDVKMRLEKFLTLSLQSKNQPRLFDLYGDYHNLIGITADLVDTLQASVMGNYVSPEYIQMICHKLFSNQVKQSVDVTRPGTAGELLRQSVRPPQGLQQTEPTNSLNYSKIKSDLISGSERTKGVLLQALRWKLTKSSPEQRDAMLAAYIENDLLGCAKSGSHRRDMLTQLTEDSELVRQYLARLLNAFASLCDGRSYLCNNEDLMPALMENLCSEQKDSLTRENILGCLQKLSLRRQMQSMMIENGMIDWLVDVLEDNDSMSDYSLEYSAALLMNLCLRSLGKKRCIGRAQRVLKVISSLMGHDNQEIIPYVNGALYSILAVPVIRQEARAMSMEDVLQSFKKSDRSDTNRQIDFIIKQLNSNDEMDEQESDDEDDEEDEEDQDAMEADLDKQELLKPQSGELTGERLLNTHYVTTTAPGSARGPKMGTVRENQEPLQRPVTPSQRRADNAVVHNLQRSANGRPLTGNGGGRNAPPSRPLTRCGSRPSSAQEISRRAPPTPTDRAASDLVAKVTGQSKKLAPAVDGRGLKNKAPGDNVDEYAVAFGSRPRVVRTPDVGSRPMSRGSIGSGPTPEPKPSEGLPTPRPSSGGRSTGSSVKPNTENVKTKVDSSKAKTKAK